MIYFNGMHATGSSAVGESNLFAIPNISDNLSCPTLDNALYQPKPNGININDDTIISTLDSQPEYNLYPNTTIANIIIEQIDTMA